MRLICGLITLDGSNADAARVDAMAASLHQPHAKGHVSVWNDGSAAFAVLDFASAEANAIVQTSAGSVLAADVRLDDIPWLQQKSGTSSSAPDTLAAHALDRWGQDAPEKLLGDFALAHWNPAKRELLLARDIAGVRPLVYHHAPGRHFLFASFPSAIHASGLLPRELDEAALVHSMYMIFSKTETLSRGVVALPPAGALRLHNDRVDVRTYWQPALQPRRHRTPADAAEELRSLLTSAVETRLPANGNVAAHLSGGLDSSGLAILAARALRRQHRHLYAYSFLLRPEERILGDDESPYVEAVLAQEPDIVWQPVHPGTSGDLRLDPDRVLPLDEDNPENVVCRYAGGQGAQVIFSGWGGDEGATFNGRGMLAHALRFGRLPYLLHELQAQRRVRGHSLRSLVLGGTISPLLPDWASTLADRIRRRHTQDLRPNVLQPGSLSHEQHRTNPLLLSTDLRKTQLALLSSGHIATRATNWALIGARRGIAFAFPLLDRRIQEFALSLPATWHVRDGWRRRPYRDAMEGVLPEVVRWRHEKLAPIPQVNGALSANRGRLLQQLDHLEQHPRVRAIFNVDAVRDLVRLVPENVSGKPDTQAIYAYASGAQAITFMAYVAQHF